MNDQESGQENVHTFTFCKWCTAQEMVFFRCVLTAGNPPWGLTDGLTDATHTWQPVSSSKCSKILAKHSRISRLWHFVPGDWQNQDRLSPRRVQQVAEATSEVLLLIRIVWSVLSFCFKKAKIKWYFSPLEIFTVLTLHWQIWSG